MWKYFIETQIICVNKQMFLDMKLMLGPRRLYDYISIKICFWTKANKKII